MKNFFKLIFTLIGFISLSIVLLSFGLSNEKFFKWIVSSTSKDLGFQSEITTFSSNWYFYQTNIKLKNIIFSSLNNETIQLASAEEVELVVNILDFFLLRPSFSQVNIKKGLLDLKQNVEKNKSVSNRLITYLIGRTDFEAEEIKLTGQVNEVNVYEYFYLFLNSEEEKYSSKVVVEDLFIQELRLGPFYMSDTTVNMEPSETGVKFKLSSLDFDGLVHLRLPISRGLEIELNFLNLDFEKFFTNSEEDIFSYLMNNLQLPVWFSTKKINLNERNLGSWKFLINKKKNTLFIDQIEGSYKNILLGEIDLNKKAGDTNNQSFESANSKLKKPIKVSSIKSTKTKPPVLSISRYGKEVRTSFQGEIHSEDLNKSLEILNTDSSESNFIAKETLIIPNISWEGFPNEFNVQTIEGTLAFKIDNLLIKEFGESISNATGLLKLISLFNVTHTFEGLTNLNFRRNFSSGFQADRVEGTLKIDSSKIQTANPIIFHTGSGKFIWDGYVNKSKNGEFSDLDFEVIMRLPIKEYLPAYALILGGPLTAGLVYIAGKAFEKPLNKLSSGKWRVTGSLEEPKVEFLEWFEN